MSKDDCELMEVCMAIAMYVSEQARDYVEYRGTTGIKPRGELARMLDRARNAGLPIPPSHGVFCAENGCAGRGCPAYEEQRRIRQLEFDLVAAPRTEPCGAPFERPPGEGWLQRSFCTRPKGHGGHHSVEDTKGKP